MLWRSGSAGKARGARARVFQNYSHRAGGASKLGVFVPRAHNEVNVRLGKPAFDCNLVDQRWRDVKKRPLVPPPCGSEFTELRTPAAGAGLDGHCVTSVSPGSITIRREQRSAWWRVHREAAGKSYNPGVVGTELT